MKLIHQQHSNDCGPAVLQMIAEYYGMSYTRIEELVERIPMPAIALWTGNHYVVVADADDSLVHVLDPARGSVDYTLDEFQCGWYQEGRKDGVVMMVNL